MGEKWGSHMERKGKKKTKQNSLSTKSVFIRPPPQLFPLLAVCIVSVTQSSAQAGGKVRSDRKREQLAKLIRVHLNQLFVHFARAIAICQRYIYICIFDDSSELHCKQNRINWIMVVICVIDRCQAEKISVPLSLSLSLSICDRVLVKWEGSC